MKERMGEPRRYKPGGDAALALADGSVFRGDSFGAPVVSDGEAVFTTTMVGYQEVCTDPSFRGQIVCMTYPLIGNYGTSEGAEQSRRPWISGLVVREWCREPSHYQSQGTIDSYLHLHGIPGISGIDTRALTRRIRAIGDVRAVLVADASGVEDQVLVERARHAGLPGERDVVGEVVDPTARHAGTTTAPHIVVVDCGVKRNIVRSLVHRGARVTVVPFGTEYEAITALGPDGIVVSPGPGDPARLDAGLDLVASALRDRIPFFGICLGHQLLARCIGARTVKMKFGHRGANHPIADTVTGRISITSQNHGYEIDRASLSLGDGWKVAFVNLNDGSIEGLTHQVLPVLSTQFHPEASPGPWDNDTLFDRFIALTRPGVEVSNVAGNREPLSRNGTDRDAYLPPVADVSSRPDFEPAVRDPQ